MMFVNGFLIFSLLTTMALIYGLLLFMSDYEPNKCEMTYMFEYPQFVRISMKEDARYRKYGLYAYSEGSFTGRARKMHFDGIPVLFVPGNAGSYKQVRSLASIALRKALNSRSTYYFDYFTVDLNEELSGLNGALLYEQMEYVNHSITRIKELYAKQHNAPKSVVLIGHSMGGIIAERLLSSLNTNGDLISLVITLASPLKRLPVTLDVYAHEFYAEIQKGTIGRKNTTVIGLSGGYGDFLVPPTLANGGDLNVITTHVPKVWLPVDHLCILWCKQLILVVNRALFDVVDRRTKQISEDHEYRLATFKHHLIHNSGTNLQVRRRYESPDVIDDDGEWIEHLPRQYTVNLSHGTKNTKWYMFRIVHQPNHEALTVVARNLEVTDWVYACPAVVIRGQSRVCQSGVHLSHLSEVAPSTNQKRRMLEINMHDFAMNYPTFTHLVAKILPTSEPVVLHVDIHSVAERKLTVALPNRWSMKEHVVVHETIEKALSYELLVPHLYHVTQSYLLYLEPKDCSVQHHHASASLIVPWGHHHVHKFFTEIDRVPLVMRLHTSRPAAMANSTAYVKLTLDPDCRYKVSVKASIPKTFSQLARFYSPLLVPNIAAVVLLTFRSQINNIGTTGRCSLFFTALKDGAKPYYLLPVVKITSMLLGMPAILKFLPLPDWQVLHEEAVDFFVLVLLYYASVGIVWTVGVSLGISVMFFESTFHKLALKLLSRTVTGGMTWSDWLMKGFHKLPGFVACLLVVLSFSTCGGLALFIGCVFYFLKLSQMSQDVIENIVLKTVKCIVKKFKKRGVIPRVEKTANAPKVTETKSLAEQTDVTEPSQEADVQKSKDSDVNKSIDVNESIDSNNDANTSNEQSTKADARSDAVEHDEDLSNEESSFTGILREITENDKLFFHFTVFYLWLLVTLLNVPFVLTWAHNFKFNPKLEPDPSMWPGLILCVCAFPLWQFDLPKVEKKWYVEVSYVVYFFTVVALAYGTLNLYRLTYLLTATVVVITVHQMIAPTTSTEEQLDEAGVSYDEAKMKME